MTACTLYLVRHGALVRSAVRTYIGQLDVPLNEEGVEQAWALRQWLQPVHFARVISSDLKRSLHTARIIADAHANSIEMLAGCREISLGEWEGRTFSEIEQRFPTEYAARGRDIENWRSPGGESFADCRARVMDALRAILDGAEGNILLVAHAGVNRIILCEKLGIPIAQLHSIGQDYGCVNILNLSATRTRLKLLNFTPPTGQTRAERELAHELPVLQGDDGD